MNPSSSNINNPLIDLHQQKKQKKRQQQLEQQQLTNGLFYNNAAPIIPGQYDNHGGDPQASLPSLSNLMSTHSAIVASNHLAMPEGGQHQPQMMQRAADISILTGNNRNPSYDIATPMPSQIKQENQIYNTSDQKIIGGTVYSHHLDNTHPQGYNDNKTLSQKHQSLSQTRRPSNATLTSSKNTNSQMTTAMNHNSLTFYQRSPVLDVPSSSTENTNNLQTFFNPSIQPINPSTQQFVDFNQQKLEDPHKIYSFVPLDVNSQQKRPRKKFNEVERLYQCTYLNCTKAYGTLNHLNAHVTMQGHGPKRLPAEFKELRKQLKSNRQKKQKSNTELPTIQTQKNAPFLQQSRNYHRFLIDSHNGSNVNKQNDPYVAAAIASSGNNNTNPMVINQHSYRPYHPEHQFRQNQSFAQPCQSRTPVYHPSYHHPQQQHQQQEYTMTQQTDHHQSFQ